MTETSLHFGEADALRVRFAVSPLWETQAAVRIRQIDGDRRPLYQPWLAAHAGTDAELEILRAVQPLSGTSPDFLSPPPPTGAPSFASELDRVRATPPAQVVADLERCRDRPTNPRAAEVDELLRDPRGARDRLAAALATAWATLVEPDWPRIRRVLEDDVAYRGRQLTSGGLAALFEDLHPTLTWRDGKLVGRRINDHDRDLGGAGLLLVPSVFNWPFVSAIVDPAYQPMIAYPARGAARLWSDAPPPPDRLTRLLGRTRATLLTALDPPATTSELSARYSLALGTVSEHLTALHDSGLTGKRREGHAMRYRRTDLGQAVLDASLRPT